MALKLHNLGLSDAEIALRLGGGGQAALALILLAHKKLIRVLTQGASLVSQSAMDLLRLARPTTLPHEPPRGPGAKRRASDR